MNKKCQNASKISCKTNSESSISQKKQWKSKFCVRPHYKVICYDMIYYTYMHSSMIYVYMHVNTYVDIPLSIAQLLTILDADAEAVAGVDAELSLCLASLHVGHLLILCKYQIVLR